MALVQGSKPYEFRVELDDGIVEGQPSDDAERIEPLLEGGSAERGRKCRRENPSRPSGFRASRSHETPPATDSSRHRYSSYKHPYVLVITGSHGLRSVAGGMRRNAPGVVAPGTVASNPRGSEAMIAYLLARYKRLARRLYRFRSRDWGGEPLDSGTECLSLGLVRGGWR